MSVGIIDGVWNHSFPVTAARHARAMKIMGVCDMHFVSSYYSGDLCITWPGNIIAACGIHRKLGLMPRERVIVELRAFRNYAKQKHDPLSYPFAKCNRMRVPTIPHPCRRRTWREA